MAAQKQDLVQIIMDAPFSEHGWHHALRAMAAATNASSGQIVGIGPARMRAFNLLVDPVEPEINRRWESEMADYSSSNWRIAATGGIMEIRHEYHYEQIRAITHSSVYDEACHEGNMPYGCQTMLLNQGGLMIGLATIRSYDDGPTTEEDRAMFADLAPYMLAAARMQRSLESDAAQLVAGSLEALSVAAFLLDRQGHVGSMTGGADRLISDTKLLTLRDHQLGAPHAGEHRGLRAAIDAMLAPGEAEAGPARQALWLGTARPIRERRLCEIFRLPRRAFSFGFEPHLLVTVRQAGDIAANEREALRSMLGLTAAEAEIAVLLAEGMPRELIAQRRGTSIGTVGIQIKRLFEKTGTSREAEMVALLRRLLR